MINTFDSLLNLFHIMSQKKTLYLHIGLHKTGTSSIQRFLSRNEIELRKNHDIFYFKPDPWPIPFRKNPMEPIINVNTKAFSALADINASKIIISHENYSWLFEEHKVKKLVNSILSYVDEIKVVLYLRRQDSLAVSQKQEGTKWVDNSVAYGHELKALPSKLNYFSKNYLDFYKKAQLWSGIVGKDNLNIRVFDKDLLAGRDVVIDFMNQIGVKDISMYNPVGKINKSISKKRQLFLHLTRSIFHDRTYEKNVLQKEVLNMELDDDEKLLPSRNEALSFYKMFEISNIKLKNEFFLGENDGFFSEDFSMYPEKSNENISDEDISFMYSAVIKSLINQNKILRQELDEDELVDWLRKLALEIEDDNPRVALKIMRRAKAIRPDGPFINKKIIDYKDRLK